MHNTINDIRNEFSRLYISGNSVKDKTGSEVIEIINASFIADEDSIFGSTNDDYIKRELEWYRSMSLNVNDIPGETPTIWKQVADNNGFINSNYGWCIYSEENGNQFINAGMELIKNPFSRRASMIYNRPSMHVDYNKNGMSDFICTFAHQYFIRNEQLHACVFFRSNDAWAGYRNDFAWAKYVQKELLGFINNKTNSAYRLGNIYWNAASLHLYSKQFYLIDYFNKTGKIAITKKAYDELIVA